MPGSNIGRKIRVISKQISIDFMHTDGEKLDSKANHHQPENKCQKPSCIYLNLFSLIS